MRPALLLLAVTCLTALGSCVTDCRIEGATCEDSRCRCVHSSGNRDPPSSSSRCPALPEETVVCASSSERDTRVCVSLVFQACLLKLNAASNGAARTQRLASLKMGPSFLAGSPGELRGVFFVPDTPCLLNVTLSDWEAGAGDAVRGLLRASLHCGESLEREEVLIEAAPVEHPSGGADCEVGVRHCPAAPHVKYRQTLLDSPLYTLHWLERDAAVVFIVSQEGRLWRSADSGASWSDSTAHLEGGELSQAPFYLSGVNQLFPLSGAHVLATSWLQRMWYSADAGASWTVIPTTSPARVVYHLAASSRGPEADLVALSYNEGCLTPTSGACVHSALYSSDVGVSWTTLVDYPQGHVTWSLEERPRVWVAVANVPAGTPQVQVGGYQRDLYVIDVSQGAPVKQVALRHCAGFVTGIAHNPSLVIAAVLSATDQLLFQVSGDNGNTWTQALFPLSADLSVNGFNILDTRDGSLFVGVLHENSHSIVYHSSNQGSDFVPVLERVEKLDIELSFHRVVAARATFIANQALEDSPQEVRTLISDDMGGTWRPVVTSTGAPLHLVGSAARSFITPIYSVQECVGIVVANGLEGDSLSSHSREVNSYISRDSGASFSLVRNASHIYEIGDRGSLLMFARDSGHETDHFVFSYDEGYSWTECPLGGHGSTARMVVDNVRIEPGFNSQQFLIHGESGSPPVSVLVHVDFDDVHERECEDDDYELWGVGCVLGRNETFVRRKARAPCFNGRSDVQRLENQCLCSREDYECDVCFQPAQDGSNTCVPDYECGTAVSQCPLRSRGYRLLGGDECLDHPGNIWKPLVVANCAADGGGFVTLVPGFTPAPSAVSQGAIAAAVVVSLVLAALAVALATACVAYRRSSSPTFASFVRGKFMRGHTDYGFEPLQEEL